MWKILAPLTFAVAGTGTLWQRNTSSPYAPCPKRAFWEQKSPPEQQTNQNPQAKPANIWAGSRSPVAAAFVPRAVLPPAGGSRDGPSPRPAAKSVLNSPRVYKVLVRVFNLRPLRAEVFLRENICEAFGFLLIVFKHLFPLPAFPCTPYSPQSEGSDHPCVRSSHASARLRGTRAEQELQSFHHCLLVT